jgi:hypothetical protein
MGRYYLSDGPIAPVAPGAPFAPLAPLAPDGPEGPILPAGRGWKVSYAFTMVDER